MLNEYKGQLVISPYIGLGSLSFGQTRSEVRAILGEPSKSFRKGPFADNKTDEYRGVGIHTYFDLEDRLEFIEAFAPADVSYRGIRLSGSAIIHVVEQLGRIGLSHRDEQGSVVFEAGGFSLYAIDERVASVGRILPVLL